MAGNIDRIFIGAQFDCAHNKYIVDEKLDYVKCGLCGKHLNPMWVISQFSYNDTRAQLRIEALNKIAAKAERKNRCKCEHCGKMTRIEK